MMRAETLLWKLIVMVEILQLVRTMRGNDMLFFTLF